MQALEWYPRAQVYCNIVHNYTHTDILVLVYDVVYL